MDWTSAPITVDAPLEPAPRPFLSSRISAVFGAVETFLERERAQLPLWFAAAFGAGIAGWMWMPGPPQWLAFNILALGSAATGLAQGPGRTGRVLFLGGLAVAAGCSIVWWRSEWVAAPRLDRPSVVSFEAVVERLETRAARNDVRLTLETRSGSLPPRVRVSVPIENVPDALGEGSGIRLRARLQPPPPMALPGSHDFARDAWFAEIGGVGRAIGAVELVSPTRGGGLDALRNRLGTHIGEQLPGGSGGIATALATGDQSAVGEEDAEAMRRSGLAHLLSVSGLHIAAVIGATMFLMLKLLALSQRLALRYNLILVAAAAGALVGVAYTLLTGMQVPTVRACIASLLVLAGIALGREAFSLRLVAVAALVILLFRPEAVAGASFQMSFAAVTAIIAFHHWPPIRALFSPREEVFPARLLRGLASLLLTGLMVEVALMPFALYHFHKAGIYGVLANLIAIPLTTFVIMPLEAAALILDTVGLGAPIWAATGWTIDAMLGLAHGVGSAQGAVTMLPTMPRWAFGLMVFGGLWLCLWTSRIRALGFIPFAIGIFGALAAPIPNLLVTGDGQHLAIVRSDGVPVLLRSRSGEFVRDLMSEASAFDGEPANLEDQRFARCSREACVADIAGRATTWRLLAVRSRDRFEAPALARACADADIVVADRRLPRTCRPRWLKLDGPALERTGGIAIYLGNKPRIETVRERLAAHPWNKRSATIPLQPARRQARFPKGR